MQSNDLSTTILSGASQSGIVDLGNDKLAGFIFPAAWDTADLTFLGSKDGVTFYPLYNESGETTVNITVGALYIVRASNFFYPRYLKLRSGTSATPVNQTADRTFTVLKGNYV